MIGLIGTLLAFIASIILMFNVQLGVLLMFASKPIIDTAWSYVFFGGMSPTRMTAVLFPLLIFIHVIGAGKRFSDMPLFGIWLIYLIFVAFSSVSALLFNGIFSYIDQMLRVANGFIGFYMMQAYFSDTKSFEKLLKFLLLASIFPLAVSMYQLATGAVLQERIATGGFSRNVGFYHDAITLRQYCFQTLIAIFLYWAYFLKENRDTVKKVFLFGLALVSVVSIFMLYTKAGYMTLALWIIIWVISRKRFASMAGIILLLMLVGVILFESVLEVTNQVYGKELSAIGANDSNGVVANDMTEMQALNGRLYHWTHLLEEYANASAFTQLMGKGTGSAAHNDFLYKLVANGLVGLCIYVVLLYMITSRVLKNFLKDKDPLNVAALMLITMWFVDSIGAVPSAYINYQWYVWGIIGLSLKGLDNALGASDISQETDGAPAGVGRILNKSSGREILRKAK